MEKSKKIIVGITAGDMNGIGPEILLSVLSKNLFPENGVPVVYASYENLENTKNHLSMNCELGLSPRYAIENFLMTHAKKAPAISKVKFVNYNFNVMIFISF